MWIYCISIFIVFHVCGCKLFTSIFCAAAPEFEDAPELTVEGNANISLECSFDSLGDDDLQYQVTWYLNDGVIFEETLTQDVYISILQEDQLTALSYNDTVSRQLWNTFLGCGSRLFQLGKQNRLRSSCSASDSKYLIIVTWLIMVIVIVIMLITVLMIIKIMGTERCSTFILRSTS